MARPIQYRAWDKEAKRFLPEAYAYVIVPGIGMLSEVNGVIYQEFSGCLDKDGKPIYEGDILADKVSGLEIGKVTFEQGCFGVQIEYDAQFFPFSEFIFHETKIVGNILENPELVAH
jgi:hypothetical protein